MEKYIVFGTGNFGQRITDIAGVDSISYFIDNDVNKHGKLLHDKKIFSLPEGLKRRNNERIIVAVSEKYYGQIADQLTANGIYDYISFSEAQQEIIKNKIFARPDYIDIYKRAIKWVKNNTIAGEGIINNTKLRKSYPEVTGYFIPTLIQWGYKDLALSYAEWLCSIQKSNGAWYDTDDTAPYIFDSAQILKGLCAVHEYYTNKEELKNAIIKGCEWILTNMTKEGRLRSDNENAWGDGRTFSELIHTYCLSPLVLAGRLYDRPDFEVEAKKILNYYTKNYRDKILSFGLLSHFYAYVMEALLDMGENDLAKEAMDNIAGFQRESGAVPAYNDVEWVCSTGLFQLSIVWYRLGDIERGNKAFEYACKLQNESGGWYGSYPSEGDHNETNTYFPDAEISWAVKYFLDALYYRNRTQFENQASLFGDVISIEDGRYKVVKTVIQNEGNASIHVLDAGCGKGRYLRNLISELPINRYYAVDLSLNVMKYFSDLKIEDKKQGNLTNIPYGSALFDVTYTCEALEHAVDVERAIAEMARVTKPGGKIVVVDKNKNMYGYFEIEQWEQWFEESELKDIMLNYCSRVDVIKDVSFDDQQANGLFYAWVGTIKE